PACLGGVRMPLTIQFDARCVRPAPGLAPPHRIVVSNDVMQTEPGHVRVAEFNRQGWLVAGIWALVAAVGGQCRISFAGDGCRSAAYGPVSGLALAGDALYLDGPGRRLLARFDGDRRQWFVYPEQRSYPAVIIEAV